MLMSLIIWLLALYGAVGVAWNVFRAVRKRKHQQLTPIHAVVLVQNGADVIEGCLTPFLKGSIFLKRELTITVLDIESKDETLKILEKLAAEETILNVMSCTEPEETKYVNHLLQTSDGFVCYIDLRKSQDPTDMMCVLSRACGGNM